MDDRTVIQRSVPESGMAYLFWVSPGIRGSHTRLRADGVTFGAGQDADVTLPGQTVDEQARVRREDGEWFVYDLAGDNATTVDGAPVYRASLRDGQRLAVAGCEAIFRTLE